MSACACSFLSCNSLTWILHTCLQSASHFPQPTHLSSITSPAHKPQLFTHSSSDGCYGSSYSDALQDLLSLLISKACTNGLLFARLGCLPACLLACLPVPVIHQHASTPSQSSANNIPSKNLTLSLACALRLSFL